MKRYDFILLSANGGIMHCESPSTIAKNTYQSYENMFTNINAYTTSNRCGLYLNVEYVKTFLLGTLAVPHILLSRQSKVFAYSKLLCYM